MQTIKFLKRVLREHLQDIFILGIISLFSGLLGGIGVGAILPLISLLLGQGGEPADQVSKIIIGAFNFFSFKFNIPSLLAVIAGLFIVRAFILFIFGYIRSLIIYNYKERLWNEFFLALLGAKWQFLVTQKVGHLQNVFIKDVDRGADILGSVSYLLFSIINAAIFFIFALLISPYMILFILVGSSVVILVFYPVLTLLKKVVTELTQQNKFISQFLIEHISGIKSIKSGTKLDVVLAKGKESFAAWKILEFKTSILRLLNQTSLEPFNILFVLGALWFSYHTPGFSFQAFAATIFLVQRTFVYIQNAQASLQGLTESLPYARQMIAFKDSLTHSRESSHASRVFKFNQELEFRNVHFSYTQDEIILIGTDFKVKKGEMVGLIGPSGSGKTTIADIMMRLLDPRRGTLMLDGIDAKEFEITSWRKNFGYVSQDIFLLNDTIENNIKFYNHEVREGDMVKTAKQANIYEFIKGLKSGFQTLVGDRGTMLSAGQRQRVVLARVLARHPEILILDEATSALDNESESLIQNSIRDLKGKITILVIAHRLSTVVDLDRILVLDKGKITEEGGPQELLQNKDSYFYRMYHLKEN